MKDDSPSHWPSDSAWTNTWGPIHLGHGLSHVWFLPVMWEAFGWLPPIVSSLLPSFSNSIFFLSFFSNSIFWVSDLRTMFYCYYCLCSSFPNRSHVTWRMPHWLTDQRIPTGLDAYIMVTQFYSIMELSREPCSQQMPGGWMECKEWTEFKRDLTC